MTLLWGAIARSKLLGQEETLPRRGPGATRFRLRSCWQKDWFHDRLPSEPTLRRCPEGVKPAFYRPSAAHREQVHLRMGWR